LAAALASLAAGLPTAATLLAAARHRDAHATARRTALHLLATARGDTHDESDHSQIAQQR
jgi:hypothetical protein